MSKAFTSAAGVLAVIGAVALAVTVGPIVGAVAGGVIASVANWWFPVLGSKIMAVTFTNSVWDGGLTLGFFSGFLATRVTNKKS